MTAGEIPSEGVVVIKRQAPRLVDPYMSYAADLTADLLLKYQSQQPSVFDQGVSGEITANGITRLQGLLSAGNVSQVLLLMEGANDIPGGTSSILPTASNMETMVRMGKAAGMKVFLANLPPQDPTACTGSKAFDGCPTGRTGGAPYVVSYNNALAVVAAAETIPLVDVYTAYHGDLTLIDVDGLHPTAAGYKVIADAFFASIEKNLEVTAATANPSLLQKSLFALPWRR